MSQPDRELQMFVSLVTMFHLAAMQQMGKIKNPLTDSIERNLEAARESIDLLEMLRSKTHGNLSADETRLLEQVLQELRLNFVDESSKPKPTAEAGEAQKANHASDEKTP
jgi:hypothetical protein